MKSLLIAVLFSAIAACPSFAGKLKVPLVYPTIQSAVLGAQQGDVIEISKGVYKEEVMISLKANITLRAKKGHEVIIDAGGTGMPIWVNLSPCVVLENLRVRNTKSWGGILVTGSSHTEIKGCHVADVALDGILFSLSNWCTARDCVVVGVGGIGISVAANNCLVTDCSIAGTAKLGISVLGNHNTVEKNYIHDTLLSGIGLGTTSDPCKFALVAENDIYTTGNCGITVEQPSSDCTIIENSIQKADGKGIYLASGTHVVRKNDIRHCVNGIVVYGPQTTLDGNKLRNIDYTGIYLMGLADYGLLARNKVRKCGTFGYIVGAGVQGNLLLKNKSSKSGNYGLRDDTKLGDNTYYSNKFGSIAP